MYLEMFAYTRHGIRSMGLVMIGGEGAQRAVGRADSDKMPEAKIKDSGVTSAGAGCRPRLRRRSVQ